MPNGGVTMNVTSAGDTAMASNQPIYSPGIDVGASWTMPLVAVRDRNGRVVMQNEGTTDLTRLRSALETVTR